MDCGPTCLRMISTHFGKKYSLEGLREKSHITHEGVSLLGISEAAENIGFRTTGAQIPFSVLKKSPLPCIVHWNQQHFVVIYKIQDKRRLSVVYVADPAVGKIKYTEEEFCRCWISNVKDNVSTGIVLLLEPTADFYKQVDEKINKKNLWFLFNYLRPYKGLIVQLFLGLLLGSFLQLILPFLTQSIVDFGISDQNIGYIYLVFIAQLVLLISSTSVEFIRGWILLHLGSRTNIALISDYLIKLMRLPMAYFDTKMTGDILQRISDHTRIQSFLTNSSLSILFSVFNAVIFSFVLLSYNSLIFAVFILGSSLYAGWVWLFMKHRATIDHKNFAQQASNQSTLIQLISGMQEIKLNACERQKRWEWERIQARIFRLRVKSLALSQYQDSGAILINQTKNLLITAIVATLVVKGDMTLGMMIAVQYIIGQLNAPIEQLISFAREIQDAKLSLDRLNEVHNLEDEEIDINTKITEIPSEKNIRIENLCFSYDKTYDAELVLKDINLTIPAGKTTAIVGMSGSGKTTLLKILLGFYSLQKGDIYLGENKISMYSIREWRKKCGVVMQEGFIFSDTIARNIAPNTEKINTKLLLEAVKMANIKDFIESLPLGYNTKIGGEGHGLSQGQKQRLLIARAIYKQPNFVFFDEATNALDANNEKIIMSNMNHFFTGKTSIVVAHRLSTVRNADQIVVLEKGRIVEIGTHIELINRQAVYYNLVKNQLEL